jgi:TonB family protein
LNSSYIQGIKPNIMKCLKLFLLVLFIHFASALIGQNSDVYMFLPEGENNHMPVFKGGENAMYMFLATNIHYPYDARERGVQGSVYLNFIIEKDGSLQDVTLLKGIGGGCDEEAMRVVKLMNGMWSPGTIDGEPVKVRFTLPIKFSLGSVSDSGGTETAAMDKGLKLMDAKKYEKALSYFDLYDEYDALYPDAKYLSGLCRYLLMD